MTVCCSSRTPGRGICWIFTNARTGATQHASVESSTPTHCLALTGREDDLNKVSRLSRASRRPTWLVRSVTLCSQATAYYDAPAVGDLESAEMVQRAIGRKGPMP
jgi:hypothetical protein